MGENDDKLSASAVRKRVLAEHVRLRELLADLERAARWAHDEGPPRAAILQARARAVRTAFESHLAMEGAMLAPVVRRMAWGRARCARMELGHQQQRHRLDAFERDLLSRNEELPKTAEYEEARRVAEALLQRQPMWWEPGASMLLNARRELDPVHFRIHISEISGRRAGP